MEIAAEGSNLSFGQRQLICFARICLAQKKLVLLDEATANIDVNTEGKVTDLLNSSFKQSTVLIIAHRINTVLNCDRIMALEGGEIIEFDTPQNLLRNEAGYFKSIYEKMLQEEATR